MGRDGIAVEPSRTQFGFLQLPRRTSIRSATTPKSELTNRVGKKFTKATRPTTLADLVICQPTHPMITRCAQRPLSTSWRLKT